MTFTPAPLTQVPNSATRPATIADDIDFVFAWMQDWANLINGVGGLLTADDIEIGAWAPSLTDGTTAAQANTNGMYTKIGNIVRASGRITATSMAGVSGGLRISGLPFIIANTSAGQGAGQVARATGLNLASASSLDLFTQQGTDFVYLYRWSNAGTVAVQAGEVTDSADIQFMVVYQV